MKAKEKNRPTDEKKQGAVQWDGDSRRERPKRAQCEIDLETLDYQRQGFSLREIAERQGVHLNTVFCRVQRARKAEQTTLQNELKNKPPRSDGQRLQGELAKLRQLERAFWPRAAAGDVQALWGILRVMRESRRVEKLTQRANPPAQAAPRSGNRPWEATQDDDRWKYLYHKADTGDWNYYIAALPHHRQKIIAIRDELRRVEIERERRRKQVLTGSRGAANVEAARGNVDRAQVRELWTPMPGWPGAMASIQPQAATELDGATTAGATEGRMAPQTSRAHASGAPLFRVVDSGVGLVAGQSVKEHQQPDTGHVSHPDPRPAKDPSERARQLKAAQAFAQEQAAWLTERKATLRAQDKLRAQQAAERSARQPSVAAAQARREQGANTCANANEPVSAEKPGSTPQQAPPVLLPETPPPPEAPPLLEQCQT